MSFIILAWPMGSPEFVLPVMNDEGNGEAMLFETEEKAAKYAEKQLNDEWKVVDLS